jgi:hypothetical protein
MAPRSKRNGQIDEEIEESFPASDPPAFMAGEVLGAPKGRKTPRRRRGPLKKARKTKRPKHAKAPAAAKNKKRATKKTRAR